MHSSLHDIVLEPYVIPLQLHHPNHYCIRYVAGLTLPAKKTKEDQFKICDIDTQQSFIWTCEYNYTDLAKLCSDSALNNHYFISDYIKRNNAGRIYGVCSHHAVIFCSQIKLACTQYVNACKYFKWSNWNLTKSNWIYYFETCVCDARPFESGTKK